MLSAKDFQTTKTLIQQEDYLQRVAQPFLVQEFKKRITFKFVLEIIIV